MTPTAEESTVLRLQRAADGGREVLIPGAWQPRAAGPSARSIDGAGPPTPRTAGMAVVSDREQLEREREGGGAPRERRRGRRASLLARLWRATLHPTEIAVIWSPPLPQRQ